MRARTVLAAAVTFAIAMAALEHGGWWWAWLLFAVLLTVGIRLPDLCGVKLSPTARYIIRHNRRMHRNDRRRARALRRARRNQRRLRRRRT